MLVLVSFNNKIFLKYLVALKPKRLGKIRVSLGGNPCKVVNCRDIYQPYGKPVRPSPQLYQ